MEEATKAAEVTTGQPQSAKEASLQGCRLSHISEMKIIMMIIVIKIYIIILMKILMKILLMIIIVIFTSIVVL